MIKKILAYICIIVLLVLAYLCIFKGTSVANFQILSYKEMIAEQKEYESKITNYDNLVNNTYQTSLKSLETAKTSFERNKSSYEELKAYSSYEELLELTRDKQYPIEFLWIKLDLVARNNNLDAKYNLYNSSTGASKNLEIKLTGDYLAIKNYIYDILIDLDLQFKAQNITIVPNGDMVEATFTVKDIKVVM